MIKNENDGTFTVIDNGQALGNFTNEADAILFLGLLSR